MSQKRFGINTNFNFNANSPISIVLAGSVLFVLLGSVVASLISFGILFLFVGVIMYGINAASESYKQR